MVECRILDFEIQNNLGSGLSCISHLKIILFHEEHNLIQENATGNNCQHKNCEKFQIDFRLGRRDLSSNDVHNQK